MPDFGTTLHPGMLCPACGLRVDAATPLTGKHAPSDGDLALCINCGAINIYANGVRSMRLPTDDERESILADPEVNKMRLVLREAHERFGP